MDLNLVFNCEMLYRVEGEMFERSLCQWGGQWEERTPIGAIINFPSWVKISFCAGPPHPPPPCPPKNCIVLNICWFKNIPLIEGLASHNPTALIPPSTRAEICPCTCPPPPVHPKIKKWKVRVN